MARVDLERRKKEEDERPWVTLTMEAPVWMLWAAIAVAVATMVFLYLTGAQ